MPSETSLSKTSIVLVLPLASCIETPRSLNMSAWVLRPLCASPTDLVNFSSDLLAISTDEPDSTAAI